MDGSIKPWDPLNDASFHELILSPEASNYGLKDKNGDEQTPDESWTTPQKEIWIYEACLKLYNTELEAYTNLKTLQGIDIPQLYANILIDPINPDVHFQIHGLYESILMMTEIVSSIIPFQCVSRI